MKRQNKTKAKETESSTTSPTIEELFNDDEYDSKPGKLKITLIADTHNQHQNLTQFLENEIGGGDILIHAGDFCKEGTLDEVNDFLDWFQNLKSFKHKIFIAGNHDSYIQKNPQEFQILLEKIRQKSDSLHYLQDNMIEIEIENESENFENCQILRIYGSSWVPWPKNYPYHNSFSIGRGNPELMEKWKRIPTNLDILVTHSPPYGILDEIEILEDDDEEDEEEEEEIEGMVKKKKKLLGCQMLRSRLKVVKSKIHVFGHVHQSYGYKCQDLGQKNSKSSRKCHFFNAALEHEHDPFKTNAITSTPIEKSLKKPISFLWDQKTNQIDLI